MLLIFIEVTAPMIVTETAVDIAKPAQPVFSFVDTGLQ
jgi:hypothetical protein